MDELKIQFSKNHDLKIFIKSVVWIFTIKYNFNFRSKKIDFIFYNKSSKIVMKVCNTDRFQFHAWKGFDFWPLNFFCSNCCCCAELQFWTTRHVFHHIQLKRTELVMRRGLLFSFRCQISFWVRSLVIIY